MRTVREYHHAMVEAENEEAVEQMYEDGSIETNVLESKITSEDGPYIVEQPSV
jgi:hypothetical protein